MQIKISPSVAYCSCMKHVYYVKANSTPIAVSGVTGKTAGVSEKDMHSFSKIGSNLKV